MSTGHLLVGIDGSPGAEAALAWAAAEARLRGVGLVLVTAYRFPLAFAGTGADPGLAAPDEQRDADSVLSAALRASGDLLDGLAVEQRVIAGEGPGHALVEASREAELLVLGARGRGGISGMTLGSVSHYCVGRAHCPVVTVPVPG